MAETRTVNLEIKDNVKSLKTQYKEAVQEVQKLADAYGATSTEAANAAKKAAQLKDRIEESKSLTDAFNPDAKFNSLSNSIGGVLNGFQAYEGAMGLIGVESEDLQKTLLKVQSAMALSQGIQGALEAKDAFKNLGSVVKNAFTGMTSASKLFAVAGIGLLITGITLLITNFEKVTAFIQPIIDKVKQLSDFIGISDFAGEERAKNERERYDNERKNIERNNELRQRAFDNEQKGIQRTIDLYKAQGKDVTELTRLKLKNSLDVKKALLEEILLLEKNAKFYAERGTNLQKAVSNAIIDNADLVKQEILDIENEIKIFDINAKKEAVDRNKDFSEKQIELARQIEKERIDAMKDGMEKRLALLKFNEEGELLQIKGKGKKEGDLRTAIETRYETERNKVKEEFRVRRDRDDDVNLEAKIANRITTGKLEVEAEKAVRTQIYQMNLEQDEKDKERIKRLNEFRLQSIKDGLQIVSNLTELFAGKSKKQQQKAFQIQKAVNIASAVVDTYKAANTALASSPPPFNYIAMAASITAGIVNVKKIASQKFEGGSGDVGGNNTPSAPETTQAAPQFNTIGSSGVNQLAQLQQQPVQAYVVSGDVTSAQSLDRNRIQNATL